MKLSMLTSFQILSDAGITPSNTKTYTSAAIVAAIEDVFGYAPVILCDSSVLYQIYYGFYVTGPLQNADFVPSTVTGDSSNCPASGVSYPIKSGATTVPTTTGTATTTATKTTTTATSTATGTVSGTGYWNANYGGAVDGCLISAGTWYTTGTCATFTATTSGTSNHCNTQGVMTDHESAGTGFTLKSSKGSCGVVSGAISCASGVTATVFTVRYYIPR